MNRDIPLFPDSPVAKLIERSAIPLFVFVAIVYLVSFNGQWRMGLDSANYRGLARSIATGHGYHFGDWAGNNVYPGFPLLLAGLERAFDESAIAPCIVLLIMSMLTLLVTYRLIHLHYPRWIAITITFGTAMNSWYMQQTSELMTDIPFLLGVMTSLYGWDLLSQSVTRSKSKTLVLPSGTPRGISDREQLSTTEIPRDHARNDIVRSVAVLLVGLLIAASSRPTFLVLLAAWGIACAIGFVFALAPSRKFYAISLAIILLTWLTMAAIDPRVKGFHPLAGGYEREVLAILPGDSTSRLMRVVHILNKQLPSGFFGEQVSLGSFNRNGVRWTPTAIFLSIALVVSIPLLTRRHPLWMLYASFALLTTVIYSDEPRYYLMILPLLLLAWLRMLMNMASLMPAKLGQAFIAGGLALVTLNNISSSVHFVREQRTTPFLEHYRDGKMLPVMRMAEVIRRKIRPDQAVLAPSGSILSYLSERHVLTQREILPPRGRVRDFPRIFYNRKIAFAVFPSTVYRDKEPAIARLMERGILRQGKTVATTDGMRLSELRVYVPPSRINWTRMPRLLGPEALRAKPATQPVRHTKRRPRATTKPTTQKK